MYSLPNHDTYPTNIPLPRRDHLMTRNARKFYGFTPSILHQPEISLNLAVVGDVQMQGQCVSVHIPTSASVATCLRLCTIIPRFPLGTLAAQGIKEHTIRGIE